MFGRVAIADHHAPFVVAGAQPRAFLHPYMADRQIGDGAGEATPALFREIVDQMLVPAAEAPFVERLFRHALSLVGEQHPGQQPFGPVHVQGHLEPFGQPAGAADMIGMIMGDDDLGCALSPQRTLVEQMLPGIDHFRHEQAGIGDRKAGAAVGMAVCQHPVVDMAKRTRHRRAGPANAGHQFKIFTEFRFIIAKRISQAVRFNRIEAVIGEHRIIGGGLWGNIHGPSHSPSPPEKASWLIG